MPEENKKEWIVLINRAPKGPLVQKEVQALIQEGIIRRNDLACLVHKDKSQKSEWKFLWQYPEFDRRVEPSAISVESDENSVLSDSSPIEERRAPLHEEDLKFKTKSLLPEEIESIKTEDLIFHSTSISKQSDAPELSEEDLKLPEQARSRPELVFIGFAVLIVAVIFLIKGLRSEKTPAVDAAANKMALPLEQKTGGEGRAPATNITKRPAMPVVQTQPKKIEQRAPEARDSGEIAYDEYRRKRDAEIERERQKEEEERAAAENKANSEENGDEDGSPKKNKKKDRDGDEIQNEQDMNPVSEEPHEEEEHPPEE